MGFFLLPVEKKTVFPVDDRPNPRVASVPVATGTPLGKEAIREAVRENIGIQIALCELRRYLDAPAHDRFSHNIGLSHSAKSRIETIGGLFSSASLCSAEGSPCCVAVTRPTSQAIEALDELSRGGEINPLVSRFMGRESAIPRHDVAPCQVVFDPPDASDVTGISAGHYEFFDYFRESERNKVREVCQYMGIDETGLKKTIAKYNHAAEIGRDEDFKTDPRYIRPVREESGHVYCYRILPGGYDTLGGLMIDENANVLDSGNMPIEGLYAAGDMTAGSLYGDAPSNAGGTVYGSMPIGMIAGDAAAAFVKGAKRS